MRQSMQTLLLVVAAAISSPVAQGALIINEIHADPDATFGDANHDGVRNSSQDEFIELVNSGVAPLDVSGWTVSDAVGVRHRFDTGQRIDPWQALVVFGGGSPAGDFGGALIDIASTGSLSLNNSGDAVVVHDAAGRLIDEVTYGSAGGRNVSLNRSPELRGPFTAHTDLASARFSPGTLANGAPFSSVPEPGSLAVTLLGLAAVATLRRYRRQRPRFPAR